MFSIVLFAVIKFGYSFNFQTENSPVTSCGPTGHVHLIVLWSALGVRMTRNALSSLRNQTGLRILEVHLKQWPKSASDFAVCHRNFYANNHAEKNFSVPSQFFEDSFVEKVKGTGPFTVVATAVSCFSASNVTVASCGQAEECDNAPKSVFLVSLKKRLRKTFSKGNKYAIHATVNRNEAMHDAESLFGPGYYEALVRKKLGGATWNGAVRRDQTVGCVKLIGREA
uniref:Uncharacterized protein n=1 Tax=Tetraselmis sp. GSL018 TaxID=582737 RepID=A0A061QNQ1_9CHLO